MRSKAVQPIRDGETLRRLREALGLSQRELARALDMNRVSVVRWERGVHVLPGGLLDYAMHGLMLSRGRYVSIPPAERGGKEGGPTVAS